MKLGYKMGFSPLHYESKYLNQSFEILVFPFPNNPKVQLHIWGCFRRDKTLFYYRRNMVRLYPLTGIHRKINYFCILYLIFLETL